MTSAALGLAVAFFLVAFVARSVVQRLRTGDWGFRLTRSLGVGPRLASGLMTSGLALAVVGIAGDLMDLIDPIGAITQRPLRASGLALMTVALVATFKAQLDLRESWRIGVDTDERTDLVTDGVFALVRNPIFSGMLLFGVGVALAVPNWLTMIALPVLIAGLEIQVRAVEEPYLLEVHGAVYRSYVRKVGRFVPLLGRRVGR